MSRHQGGKGTKNAIASFSKGIVDVQCKSIFGAYSEAEMIAQLKALAMDPCKPDFSQDNILPLSNQIARLRKIMTLEDSAIPWRKRKLEQFVNKMKVPADFVLPSQQNTETLRRRQLSHASSVSCLLNSVDSTHSHHDKFISDSRTSSSLVTFDAALPEKQFVDNVADLNCPVKDISQTVDSDESVNGSNPLSPENSTPNEAPPSEISNAIPCLNLPISDGACWRHLDTPRRSNRLLNFVGDHLQRKVIPIGSRFQADVPVWNGPFDKNNLSAAYKSDSDNCKWLGTRDWPIMIGNMKSTGRKIGKGKSNSCSCPSPGSADCIKRHILEKRLILQCDLGPAFFSWKFDEMGEQVSMSWSQKEQQIFETLMERRSSDEKSFWKRALKCLSNKQRKDIVNYYFDVYIPQRMGLQTRLTSMKQVDTDDEEEDNSSCIGLHKKSERRKVIMAKNTEARYLRSS